jgi:hypothetical protein
MSEQVNGSLPRGPREAQAWREVGYTAVRPATVRFLLIFFLVAIAVVPLFECAGVRSRAAEEVESAWSHLAWLPGQVSARLGGAELPVADPGVWARIVGANRAVLAGLHTFEHALEDESLLGRRLRPPAQRLLSGSLGAGNERAYVGREGWLFYRPDVEHVTGTGFLEPRQLARRVRAASEWEALPQPDPRVAIAHFHRQLRNRGVTLIVVPTPVKPTVHPGQLAGAYDRADTPVQNPSHSAFVEDLRREGVLVFDAADMLVEARVRSGRPQYLATDTHWRPETMEAVAARLAALITEQVVLPSVADPGYRTQSREVQHSGDIALMLDLPADQTLYPPETAWTRRIVGPDGEPWRPSREADVLVLGDSFSNIYSLETMGWGDAAGLVEQVSYELRRPVDRLVQNDAGAHATRGMLRRALASEAARFDRTRVVIYQFATRELSFGDWQIIELP